MRRIGRGLGLSSWRYWKVRSQTVREASACDGSGKGIWNDLQQHLVGLQRISSPCLWRVSQVNRIERST